MIYLLYISIILVVSFSFTNGMKDGCNVLATAIASQSISRKLSLTIVTISEFIGPFIFGIPVAMTVAKGIINVDMLPPGMDSVLLILSGVAGAILWNLLTWLFSLPTSSSFALVGGLIGPAIYKYGIAAVPWSVFLVKVIGAMFLSPVLGILFGYLAYRLFEYLLRNSTLHANNYLRRFQIFTLIALGLSHGTNDSQKAMGIIALLLVLAGILPSITIPLWVMALSAFVLATGITMGGTKIIKTVGYSIFRVRPVHSLTSQVSAFSILLACNLLGAPVSTTQIISSSVIGVGSAFRPASVKWKVIYNIFLSWLLTIPLAGGVAALVYILLKAILFGG